MTISAYKPWLRNLHVRRAFILFVVPFILPAWVVFLALQSLVNQGIPEIIQAWKAESRQTS